MIDNITNEILVASMVMHTNNINLIAGTLGYSPLIITNALYAGARNGKLKYNKDKNIITISEDVEVEKLSLGEDFFNAGGGFNLNDEIEQLVRNLNSDETDMSAEELMTWIPGSTDTKVKMVAYLNPNISTYELKDRKDKKSTYTFLTLNENIDKQWGKKQFSEG